MAVLKPFDAVLLVAFGGPRGPADVRPFLANVLRGRRVSPERIEEVVRHYDCFGGVSPLTDITMRQASGLETRLLSAGAGLPVYVGMRNWHPMLSDTLKDMAAEGVRRAIGIILAPHRSYSSCTQYRQNVAQAGAAVAAAGLHGVDVFYVGDWHMHPAFIDANRRHVLEALDRLSLDDRQGAHLVFTAHSIPASMAGADRYRRQITESSRLVAEALGRNDWAVVFQSRSGRPEDPWLGPDVCAYLRGLAGKVPAVVLVPIGFVCDHIEVLYDLDREAADVCRTIGLSMARARTVNDDPRFLDMLAELVIGVCDRYRTGRPLPLLPPVEPAEQPAVSQLAAGDN